MFAYYRGRNLGQFLEFRLFNGSLFKVIWVISDPLCMHAFLKFQLGYTFFLSKTEEFYVLAIYRHFVLFPDLNDYIILFEPIQKRKFL